MSARPEGCPHCGGGIYFKSVRCGGWWKSTHEFETGDVVDTDLDGLKYGDEPKTVVCSECKRRIANPDRKTP